MRITKVNHTLVAFVCSAMGAFATSKQTNAISTCATVPSTSGPNISSECQYNPTVQCCYIASGSTSQYVTQLQNGATVIIRRNATSMVTIYGNKIQ